MEKLRLFMVVDSQNRLVEKTYFDDKRKAKEFRDNYGQNCHVTYGPDHHKWKGKENDRGS